MTEASSGADAVVEHLTRCAGAQAALVMQEGSADEVIARLLAEGWTMEERTDFVAGKRIRYLRTPEPAGTAGPEETPR